ncbi:glutamate receptor 2.5-like isoform X2 [Oryza glaberrima]|nr:glutamate receptor 2.5-like isoform X2 [Oryza glaberrima]XP_052157822.1 glutamate receptor 2.5-like isoform X2 [Oryza glaberrima]XP_052157823.1 glutamate receptor 2.5-like isoform X2 [Oryza glaberrima]
MAFVISRELQRLNKEVNFAAFLDNPNIADVHNQSILLWSYDVIPATATSTEICRLFSSVVQTIEIELGQGGVLVARRTHADSADTISFYQLAEKLKLSPYEIVTITGEGARGVCSRTSYSGLPQNRSTSNCSFDISSNGNGAVTEDSQSASVGHSRVGLAVTHGTKTPLNPKTQRRNAIESKDKCSKSSCGSGSEKSNETLRIAVTRKYGFQNFLNITDLPNGKINATGFSIEVFENAMKKLDHPPCYMFCLFEGSYDDLVGSVSSGKFNATVGDVSITAERERHVDFTMPYTQSGLSILVLAEKYSKPRIQWIFIKPLTWQLWLAAVSSFLYIAFVVWMIERPRNQEYQGSSSRQISTSLYFAFSTMTFSHGQIIRSPMSKIVVVIWCFAVVILVQSYTASLSSMLTTSRLRPSVVDLDQLRHNNDYVGYQNKSFVYSLLNQTFKEDRLKPYANGKEYAEALRRGKVSAIVDEIPYIRSFMSDQNNSNEFWVFPQTYNILGFAFGFPIGSPLVHNLSVAILDMTRITNKTVSQLTDDHGSHSTPLTLENFSGLFVIVGSVSTLMLLISIVRLVVSRCSETANTNAPSIDDDNGDEESNPQQNDTEEPLLEARDNDSRSADQNGSFAADQEPSQMQSGTSNGHVPAQAQHIQIEMSPA